MANLNRRQWLKISGLTGAASIIGGPTTLKALTLEREEIKRDLENGIVRLSSNENPYGPSKKMREAMISAFDRACRYPWSFSDGLRKKIAEKHRVSPEHVVMTAGSNEGLRITGLTYGLNGGEIISADPVYKALISYAEHFGAYIHRVPLTEDFGHDLEAMEQRITLATKLVFVCNPNNPTGTLLSADKLEDFCRTISDRTLVFSDEAYFDYIAEPNYPSMIELVKKGMNVIVSRTFSKVYGLAGIRMGYLIARPDIARRVGRKVVAAPNIMALAAAEAAMDDHEFYRFSIQKNKEAKEMIYATLDELGLKYAPSHTNFVFFNSGKDIGSVQKDFLNNGVRVGRAFPPLTDWCRVSIGTLEEVEKMCGAMKKIFV